MAKFSAVRLRQSACLLTLRWCSNRLRSLPIHPSREDEEGTKPDFHGAANPEEASRLYHYFVHKVRDGYVADRVKDGKFQAMMEVALVNDGPVSYFLRRHQVVASWAASRMYVCCCTLSSTDIVLEGYIRASNWEAGC